MEWMSPAHIHYYTDHEPRELRNKLLDNDHDSQDFLRIMEIMFATSLALRAPSRNVDSADAVGSRRFGIPTAAILSPVYIYFAEHLYSATVAAFWS